MAVRLVTEREAAAILSQVGASLVRTEGAARVYASQRLGVTITVFPGDRPGRVRMQTVKGCVC